MTYFSAFTGLRALLAVCLFVLTAVTQAQTWPTRSLRLVIPFAPGGGTDILARVIAPKLSEVLGQQVVVENKPGASSIIGSQIVVQAAPDGYTLMMVDSSIYVNPGLRTELPYNTMKDLTPIVHMAVAPVILVVHPSVPVSSARDCRSSASITSSTAMPTAIETGLPPKELKYSMPLAKASATALVQTTAANGCPLPIGFPIVTMSGITPCN